MVAHEWRGGDLELHEGYHTQNTHLLPLSSSSFEPQQQLRLGVLGALSVDAGRGSFRSVPGRAVVSVPAALVEAERPLVATGREAALC